ncbi:MAG: lysine--tRNA ligase [Patescibacteria group bacterium]
MNKQSQNKEKLNINDEREIRLKKLIELRAVGIDPYPAKSERTRTLAEAFTVKTGGSVKVAGRIMSKREMGKIIFCHLQDESALMQIVFKQDELGEDRYRLFEKKIDWADIIEVAGERFATKAGEESILVKAWKLLAKTLLPLPDKFHGLQDEELRFRKRYLDLIMNPEVKDIFYRKSVFWSSMREFMLKEGFFEVETPILETTTGGADANPFVTHHDALDIDLYLRISMGELWQKRLMVAGFEKTFEIGRQFRNEGMSREHLQDYTQIEFYWAYADYEKGMDLVERLYKYVAKKTYGALKFKMGKFEDIDLNKKWERYDYSTIVREKTGVDILTANEDKIRIALDKLQIKHEKRETKGRLIDSLWKHCRKDLAGPGFLINTPVLVSPLAKRKEDNHELTQRFQVILAGSEVGNGYSELNDPIDQANRFQAQAEMREAGDREAQMHDKDFVEALEHGMPPTCGFGVSERLFSFLENKPIRECVLFPLMKPRIDADDKEKTKTAATIGPLPMSRDEAWKLVKKYNKKQANLNHYLESEAVMRKLAERLGKDIELWGMLGLLHDIDWEETEDDSVNHLTKAPEMLKQAGFDDNFINTVISHGYGFECAGLQNKKRGSDVEYALACAETVTGLIYATALMRPDKIAALEAKSVKKKFKDKSFSAKVDREVIRECEKLGLELDEFLNLAIEAMRGIAGEIGL